MIMKKIYGKKIVLRETTEKDLADLMGLWNNGEVMKWVGFPNGLGHDLEKMLGWFHELQKESSRHHFVIYDSDIGFCGEAYYAVDKEHKWAGLDIKLRPEAQGKGLASDALSALIEYIFQHEPDAEAVWTEPAKENVAARNLYRRMGLNPQPRPNDLAGDGSYWERKKK